MTGSVLLGNDVLRVFWNACAMKFNSAVYLYCTIILYIYFFALAADINTNLGIVKDVLPTKHYSNNLKTLIIFFMLYFHVIRPISYLVLSFSASPLALKIECISQLTDPVWNIATYMRRFTDHLLSALSTDHSHNL